MEPRGVGLLPCRSPPTILRDRPYPGFGRSCESSASLHYLQSGRPQHLPLANPKPPPLSRGGQRSIFYSSSIDEFVHPLRTLHVCVWVDVRVNMYACVLVPVQSMSLSRQATNGEGANEEQPTRQDRNVQLGTVFLGNQHSCLTSEIRIDVF
eukprot:GHVU01125271.1.p1 GENE.GHVU01125271.1~~GHVU01125271.1.p1  ORF type:complete len:152 (-),score=12.16 GHVU01125271.1:376-831(-)